MQAHLEGGHTRLFTRRGHDWTPRFVALAGALTDLPANNLVLDGEVIVQGETGVADFDALQAELASGRAERMVYFAFDLLHLDGFDLRMRRSSSASAFSPPCSRRPSPSASTSPSILTRPADAVFEQACAMGLEGIVCKLRDAPYRSGHRASWLKIKCVQRGGLPDPRARRDRGAAPGAPRGEGTRLCR